MLFFAKAGILKKSKLSNLLFRAFLWVIQSFFVYRSIRVCYTDSFRNIHYSFQENL